MANTKLWTAGLLIPVVGGALFLFWRTGAQVQKTEDPAPLATASSTVVSSSAAPVRAEGRKGSKAAVEGANSNELLKAFGARFGFHLKATQGARGRVVTVRGAPGQGEISKGFNPADTQKAVARAREILDAASEMLGFEAEAPLGEPVAKTGPVSAQVYFPETLNGLPVEPFGAVTVDLGPQGELLNLSSDYVGKVPVANERALTPEQAKARAEAAVPSANPSLPILGGAPIVWVSRSGPGGAPVGHHAYNYNVSGHQIVVDAANGEVLYRRDRRQQ